MKKIFLGILICGSVLFASAQSDSTTTTTTTSVSSHKYYYYPSSNVYYDEPGDTYWYKDKGSSNWNTTKTLPSTITVEKTDRYPVDYTGTDPWKNNATDIKKYKERKNGTVKKEK